MKSMKEVCEITGLTYDALKFYCIEGLVPNHKRDSKNHRKFDDKDIQWIKGLVCLRQCGMSIKDMKHYMVLCINGIDSVEERKQMLAETEIEIMASIATLQESLRFIFDKQAYYDSVLKGDTELKSSLT